MNRKCFLPCSLFLLLSLAASASAAGPAKAAAKKAPEMTAEVALLLATQNLAAGDLEGAEAVLRDAQKRFPAAHGLHLGRGALEQARGNVRAALWEYQWELLRAGADRPSGEEAARRSTVLVEAGSKDTVEVRAVLEAMSNAGTDPDAALVVVKSARANGDTFVLRVFETELRAAARDPEAESLFRQLVKMDPGFVPAHVGLANTLGRAGNTKAAQAALDAARNIDPNHWSLPK